MPLSQYKAVFIIDNPPKLNGLLVVRSIRSFFKDKKPCIFVVADRKKLTINRTSSFLRHSINEILTTPLFFHKLRETLAKSGIL